MGQLWSSSSNSFTKSRDESWVCITVTPEDVLEYNPATSYALCAGVGKQTALLNADLGVAADNDAKEVYSVLQDHYGFEKDHMTLLKSDQENDATATTIRDTLHHFSQSVGDDGILLFHFSGHALQQKNKVCLVPSDYDKTRYTAITFQDILDAIHGTKARYFIMIADCCRAGKFADDLVVNSDQTAPLYILASCSSNQKSLSFKDLGHGFFTFFLTNFLKASHIKNNDDERSNIFPVRPTIEFCQPLCKALNDIVRPGLPSADMVPELRFTNVRLHRHAYDEFDGGAQAKKQQPLVVLLESYLTDPHFISQSTTNILNNVSSWLSVTVKEALIELNSAQVLHVPELFSTVLAFLGKSMATHMFREAAEKECVDSLNQPTWCIQALLSLTQLFDEISDGPELQLKLKHISWCLQHFITQLKDLKGVTLHDLSLIDLLDFFSKIIKAEKAQGKQESEGGIECDGIEVDDVDGSDFQQVIQALESIPLLTDVPEIPGYDE